MLQAYTKIEAAHARWAADRSRGQYRLVERDRCGVGGGAMGVGLFRTELLFMQRKRPPTRTSRPRSMQARQGLCAVAGRSCARSTSAATSRRRASNSRTRTIRSSAGAACACASTVPIFSSRSCARFCAPRRRQSQGDGADGRRGRGSRRLKALIDECRANFSPKACHMEPSISASWSRRRRLCCWPTSLPGSRFLLDRHQ